MASIRIKTNIGVVTEAIKKRLQILGDKEKMLRPVCFDVIDLMTKRIHVDGKDASDAQIGTYNPSYLELRKKKFSRSGDTKIIVSLTRQLENDWSVMATPKGYGIGFLNSFNLQKARWVEENKGKIIFSTSVSERNYAIERIQEITREVLGNA